MAENAQQEMITLTGQLKSGEMFWKEGKLILKRSVNNDDYYSIPLIVDETKKNGQKIENFTDSIMLIFWAKDFNENKRQLQSIMYLKENQTITVHGQLGGRDNGLLRVIELETSDDESDIFI